MPPWVSESMPFAPGTIHLSSNPHAGKLTDRLNSYVDTPMIQPAIQSGAMEEEFQKTPAGRPAMPEEISDAIVFLASPMASFMHGAGLPVDGGYTL